MGSTDLIEAAADALGARVVKERLQAQFRCAGSDEYIDWVDTMLGLRTTDASIYDTASGFDFRIVGTPTELESEIRARAREGYSARVTAGFCWRWSDPEDNRLLDDVVIGSYRRPWNAKPDAGKLPTGVPKSNYWATDANGLEQIGCVYTAQGFEFDYGGVIWGPDLAYREGRGWVGDRKKSFDPAVKRAQDDRFVALVKNTYRVLMTRGLKGCYLYFTDDETRDFFEKHLVQHPAL